MMKLVVLSCLLAAASAGLLASRQAASFTPFSPLAYSGGYIAPLAYSGGYIAPYYNGNYRGPLSLAPGQPANILAADGRPLDTLDVNLDRSAHLTAKALEGGVHLLKKRSAPILTAPLAPVARIPLAGAPLLAHAAPLAYSAPITTAYAAPYASLAYPYARYW